MRTLVVLCGVLMSTVCYAAQGGGGSFPAASATGALRTEIDTAESDITTLEATQAVQTASINALEVTQAALSLSVYESNLVLENTQTLAFTADTTQTYSATGKTVMHILDGYTYAIASWTDYLDVVGTLTFYSDSSYSDTYAKWEATIPLGHTLASQAGTVGKSYIWATDASSTAFTARAQVLIVEGATSETNRITGIDTTTGYKINLGDSLKHNYTTSALIRLVPDIGFGSVCATEEKLFGRITFGTSQTVTVKVYTKVR